MKRIFLSTVFCSFALLCTPLSNLYATSNANEIYNSEELIFYFPDNEKEDWELETFFEDADNHFQGWVNKHDETKFVILETHVQVPDNPITIEEKFIAFIGDPNFFKIEMIKESDSEMLFVIQDIQDPNGFACVRLIVTSNAHHALSYASKCDLLEVDEKEKWILWLQDAELDEGPALLVFSYGIIR